MYRLSLIVKDNLIEGTFSKISVIEFETKKVELDYEILGDNREEISVRDYSIYGKNGRSKSEIENLRSCGYAVEDEILYYDNGFCTLYTFNVEDGIKHLKEEMLKNTNKELEKIKNKISLIESAAIQ